MAELSVYLENNIYFGVFKEDYLEKHSLTHFIIKQQNPLSYIWQFDYPLCNIRGDLCNIGAMLEASSNHFHENNEVLFVVQNDRYFGVKLEKLQMTLPLSRKTAKLTENTEKSDIANFSLNMLIKHVLLHSGKKIYIVDPKSISEAFRMIL